ncbi:hypothetical protein, variant [Aphanomyces invadans]|uniref:Glucose-methanol-choline oxidoreductase N-terminal domain-containing protein n=1 Tax=Aphanomyces invadans TaxID=157072 RepID=A0A024U4C1_9STRA|nr:hypothetical protein, variant [Aphanomyces invadans]ETW01099.1 hypothetical protein, variant [Aphanomyces invadans]|eukprot:XP_008870097.1 hypothetical protein, variant [Aphanomyces invadans]
MARVSKKPLGQARGWFVLYQRSALLSPPYVVPRRDSVAVFSSRRRDRVCRDRKRVWLDRLPVDRWPVHANYSEHKINQNPDLKHLVYGHPPFTIKHGLRDSPAKTFLGSMAKRANVVLETWAIVAQVLHNDGKASGVSYNKGKALVTAKLRSHGGAILLAAGALNTPKLLLQSGIGPKRQDALVRSLALPMSESWIANEAVGAQLFDTHQVAVTFRAPKAAALETDDGDHPFGFDYLHPTQDAIAQFLDGRAGPLASSNPVFVSYESVVHPATAREYHFQITVFPHTLPRGDNSTADPMDFTLCFNLNNPTSRAALGFFPKTTSRRHRLVYGMLPNSTLYWDNDEDLDMMVAFINETMSRLAQVNTTPIFPPPTPVTMGSSWSASPHEWVRHHTLITDHFGGTCAVGADNTSCVDSSLLVRGTSNVFVGDGSLVTGGSVNPYGFVMYSGYQASVGIKKHLTMSKANGIGNHHDGRGSS